MLWCLLPLSFSFKLPNVVRSFRFILHLREYLWYATNKTIRITTLIQIILYIFLWKVFNNWSVWNCLIKEFLCWFDVTDDITADIIITSQLHDFISQPISLYPLGLWKYMNNTTASLLWYAHIFTRIIILCCYYIFSFHLHVSTCTLYV